MHIIKFFGFLIISTCFWVSHANDSKDQEQINLLSGKVSFIIPKDFDDNGENSYINYKKSLTLFYVTEMAGEGEFDTLCANSDKACITKVTHAVGKKNDIKWVSETWVTINGFNILKLIDEEHMTSLLFMTKEQATAITIDSFDDSMLVPINIGAMTQKIIDSIVIK